MAATLPLQQTSLTPPPTPMISRSGLVGVAFMNRWYVNHVKHSDSCVEISVCYALFKCLSFRHEDGECDPLKCECYHPAHPQRGDKQTLHVASFARAILMADTHFQYQDHEFACLDFGFLGCTFQCCWETDRAPSCPIKCNFLSSDNC